MMILLTSLTSSLSAAAVDIVGNLEIPPSSSPVSISDKHVADDDVAFSWRPPKEQIQRIAELACCVVTRIGNLAAAKTFW
jgi:hypothetical protein